jgi:hypothetical protein
MLQGCLTVFGSIELRLVPQARHPPRQRPLALALRTVELIQVIRMRSLGSTQLVQLLHGWCTLHTRFFTARHAVTQLVVYIGHLSARYF